MGTRIYLAALIVIFTTGCVANSVSTSESLQNSADTPALSAALAELEMQPTPSGVDPAVYEQLTRELACVLAERFGGDSPGLERVVATPPADEGSQTVLAWDDATSTLSWGYYCTGDYDQNGEVNISDLTPLGVNFNATGPFDADSALAVIDGDGNGEINIADVTPIGQNFGVTVSGYNVYASDDAGDYPGSTSATTSRVTCEAALLDTVALTSATGDPSSDRKQFSFEVTTGASDYYWVCPTDGTSDGMPSNLVQGTSPVSETQDAVAAYTPSLGITYDLELVNGNPAFMYVVDTGDTESIYYLRANDALGTDWPDTPVLVADSLELPDARMLVLADGTPAVFFTKEPDGDFIERLYFASATDTNGSGWNAAVQADTATKQPNRLAEGLFGGYPAAAFGAQGSDVGDDHFGLRYVQATDAAGTAWGNSLYISASTTDFSIYPSVADVGVNPAVGFYLSDTNEYRYVRATDSAGTAWDTEVTIFDLGFANVGESPTLLVHAGMPVMWYSDPNGELFLHVAEDANGASWPEAVSYESRQGFWPQIVATGSSASEPLFLLYRHWTNFTRLRFVLASDSGSGYATSWESSFDLRSGGDVIGWRRLSQPKYNPANGKVYFAYPSDAGGGTYSLNLVTVQVGAS